MLLLLIFNHSICQESIISTDSVNLVKFSNKDVGINLIEFLFYKDLYSLAEQIKKHTADKNNCTVILKIKITKPDKIELSGYKSECNFENDILEFLKPIIHLKIINCLMKIDSIELFIPIKIKYD